LKWKQGETQWYIRSGDWTITKALNVPLPYGLYFMGKNHGFYATLEAAQAAAIGIVAMQA
jgi:hypothetical protein